MKYFDSILVGSRAFFVDAVEQSQQCIHATFDAAAGMGREVALSCSV